MREIKFRAFYRPYKGMLDWEYVQNSLDFYNILTNDKYAVMQYTGLRDKNGAEIYEGDILGKRPYGYFKSDGTRDRRYRGREWWPCFAVEWGEYDASEAGLVGGYEYETDGKYAGWNIVVGGYDSDLECEVIGNIYENGELLAESENKDV